MARPKYPLVEVEWLDSCASLHDWTPTKKALKKMEKGPAVCFTVGYLVAKNKRFVSVVSNASPEELGFGMTIPRANVVCLRVLK